jgi:[acyl-carrier-protein] S-malonyltransferase
MSTEPASALNLHRLLELPPAVPPLAIIFPGQGSQKVGMGQDVQDAFSASRHLFALADAASGTNISDLCFHGPADALTATDNAQPAILTTSLAYLAAALETGALPGRPTYLAGHSLGEYTALVASGSLGVADAVMMVLARGRIMAEARNEHAGTMAAILGLVVEVVEQICIQSGAEPANYNGPTQTVIGGTPSAVEKASQLARERGGKALPVNVSGAFHTSLMVSACERFAEVVDSIAILDPMIPVIGNVSAAPLETAEQVRKELRAQVARPVQWNESIRFMTGRGVRTFIEIGPGRALSAMLKRIDAEVVCTSIDSAAALADRVHV